MTDCIYIGTVTVFFAVCGFIRPALRKTLVMETIIAGIIFGLLPSFTTVSPLEPMVDHV